MHNHPKMDIQSSSFDPYYNIEIRYDIKYVYIKFFRESKLPENIRNIISLPNKNDCYIDDHTTQIRFYTFRFLKYDNVFIATIFKPKRRLLFSGDRTLYVSDEQNMNYKPVYSILLTEDANNKLLDLFQKMTTCFYCDISYYNETEKFKLSPEVVKKREQYKDKELVYSGYKCKNCNIYIISHWNCIEICTTCSKFGHYMCYRCKKICNYCNKFVCPNHICNKKKIVAKL